LGVGESSVQTAKVGNEFRINIELPGVTDINQAIMMIGETPILEFREQNTEPPREITADEKKIMDDFNINAEKKIKELVRSIKTKEEFETIAKESSDDEASKNNGGYLNYINRNISSPEIFAWAEKSKKGSITNENNIVKNIEGYNILMRGEERDGGTEVSASHILICYLGAKGCESAQYTKEEASKKAQELFNQANAENFAQLAKDNSTDLGSKDKGGDLGFFTKEIMVAEFGDAVFNAQVDQIVGPVESEFGFHIIYKTGERKMKEYEVWRILAKTMSANDILPPQQDWKETGLSGKQLKRAEVVTDPQTGAVQVSLQFNDEGSELFKNITEKNIGKPVAIYLDGVPISIPTVQSVIPNGQAVITGSFNIKEAQLLSQRLNAGALPVPVNLISQQNIGATLGSESLSKSLHAGIIGTLLVMLFMVLYYRLPGLVSVFALGLYIVLVLAVFKLIGVTLTLAGIAGFILSIGMAVDANVLIFERTKEELKEGKSLRIAVEEGFLRAWTSIRDSNLSTLISCTLLIWFGTGFVKGFAITLIIGVLISLFSAITITRVMLRFIVPWFSEEGNKLFLGYSKKDNN
jgi:protein-export membrane protein SecD